MKVGTRLYLAVMPAILGVLLVAALAYWGQRGRQAPGLVVSVAVVASVLSLVLAWRNTRYVAQRVGQLARTRSTAGSSGTDAHRTAVLSFAPAYGGQRDELDQIEATVEGLSTEVAAERDAGASRVRAAEARAAESTDLLDRALATMTTQLAEAHIPLHILLSSPFGELNENQEEILGAAEQAIDAADIELRRIRKLVDLERGAVPLIPQRIRVAELLRPSLAMAEARASSTHVRVVADIPDTLPRAIVDPMHSQDAIASLLGDAVSRVDAGGELVVSASEDAAGLVAITLSPGGTIGVSNEPPALELRLARRVLEAQRGTVDFARGRTVVTLPAERL